MPTDASLQQRANALGIAESYWDVDGNYHAIDDGILHYFATALGQPHTDDAATFDDVRVIDADTPQTLDLGGAVSAWQLHDEQQQLIAEYPAPASASQERRLPEHSGLSECLDLPALPLGYYSLQTTTALGQQRLRLLVAPPTCYRPEALAQRQLRGLMLQLYSLRSATPAARAGSENSADDLTANWGIGDFADLYHAVDCAAARGLDFIGLNPLHALYPSQPQWFSPYSPSSRIYWHWIYIAVGKLPEFTDHAAHRAWLTQQADTLQQLRSADCIDYVGVSQLKMQALRLAFAQLEAHPKRLADFEAFVADGGTALQLNSAFYAISAAHGDSADGLGYGAFPADLQDAHSAAVQTFIAENADAVRFYSYLQWLIDQQLSAVQQHAQASGLALGLYGDLAVGVAVGASDSWVNPALYSLPASIGAPPDPLGPVGQNWGLPPMHPLVLKQQGFQDVIATLRANMKHCGALRIDHVMGLYRLWLIPAGKEASHGAYVHYPFAELMAILAIESQRAQCLVIGEDLGTVPDEVREALNRYRVLSYDVLYFAGKRDAHHWRAPQAVNPNALGVVGTHDLPPLAGWWHCSDLKLLGELGIMDAAALKPLYDARLADKQALLNALKTDGYLPDNYEIDALKMAMHERLNRAIHAYAADANTHLFGIQPENFFGVEWAFNVPGTTDEYPNWQHKLPKPLSEMNGDFYDFTQRVLGDE